MSDELYGLLDEGELERNNQIRGNPQFLDSDSPKVNVFPTGISRRAQQQQLPSFLHGDSIEKQQKNEAPVFESRRRINSPQPNRNKDSNMQKGGDAITLNIHPVTDDEGSNNDENIHQKEYQPKLLSKENDNIVITSGQPIRITTPLRQEQTMKSEPYKTGSIPLSKDYDDDRKKNDVDLKDLEYRLKKKEEQHQKEIEELKQNYKEELISYQNIYKEKEKELNEEIKYFRFEKVEEIKKNKENMTMIHQTEIEAMEKKTERLLREQKMQFESENDILKRQLEQQLEYNKIATKVELSSKHIDEIMQKIRSEKEEQVVDHKSYKESLDKLEERLKKMEENLLQDKALFAKSKEAFEQEQTERRKLNSEESSRIRAETIRLEQLQQKLKEDEYRIKEKYEREKIEFTQKNEEMKLELETLKSNYHNKLSEVEYQRKMIDEEKKYFEKYKDETIKNIDNKKFEYENMKEKMYNEEKEIKGRIAIMQEKEFYLTEKFEEFERIKQTHMDKEDKIEKDRKELIIAAKRIEESIRALDEKARIIEKEKDEVMKQYNELESERMNLNSDKITIDQEKSEIRLRLQSIDMLRMKYITENRPMLSTTMVAPSTMNAIQPNMMNRTMMNNTIQGGFYNTNNSRTTMNFSSSYRPNVNTKQEFTSTRGFNADKYFDSLQNRLNVNKVIDDNNQQFEGNNQFEKMIMKEREYLKKSNESFENQTKKDYEKMKKSYLDNINQSQKIEEVKMEPAHFQKPMTKGLEGNYNKRESSIDQFEDITQKVQGYINKNDKNDDNEFSI